MVFGPSFWRAALAPNRVGGGLALLPPLAVLPTPAPVQYSPKWLKEHPEAVLSTPTKHREDERMRAELFSPTPRARCRAENFRRDGLLSYVCHGTIV